MVNQLTVYKASAGSGKTFTLAVHYIKLIVQNPQSYRTILAVTFTNKATEEMKTRILSQLYGIWKQLPDSNDYRDAVCKALNASPAFVSERAGQALHLLLHNYNYFRVMTIDTFFQSVLRNLARELDLTANLHIGINDIQVEEQAVDLMIEQLNTNDIVLNWIMNYIMENISDDKSWNVIGQIKQFGRNIFRDYYKDISKQLNERIQEKDFFEHYSHNLRAIRERAKQNMSTIGEEFFSILEQNNLSVDDLANKSRGIASFFNKLKNGIFDESVINKTVEKCLDAPSNWYSKTHPRGEEINALAQETLRSLLRMAVDARPEQWKRYQSATLTLRHLNQVRLLNCIEKKVRELNDEANKFLLSDTQKLLNALIEESDSPFIFEKIGTQLEHIMIDEFQDTSTVQWQNFKVLLLDTMSHAGSENLIVGDVKQSIYRWRSGDWRLLNDIEQEFPLQMISMESLKTNRRSDRGIVSFNNVFFTKATELEYADISMLAGADQLRRAYKDVEQDIPTRKPESGYVKVMLFPAGTDYQEQTFRQLTDIVNMLRSNRIPLQKMAILVRTNSYIPLIAKYFADHLPEVPIVSDEAFRLDASPPVCIMIQAMRLLLHPNDEIAQAYLRKTCGDTTSFHEAASHLRRLSLYELTDHLFRLFSLERFNHQGAYISAFFDQVNAYVSETAATLSEFLKLWDTEICSKTIQSSDSYGVRIISIHKSKGLEFDHVIIPFCDWQLEKNGKVLWCHPQEEPFSQLPIAPIDYSQKGMTGTIYENDYAQEHLQNVVDNLNLLYVAFTRARNSLHVIGKRNAGNSRSALIENVLASMDSEKFQCMEESEKATIYEWGTPFQFPMDNNVHGQSDQKVSTPNCSRNVFLQPSSPLEVQVTSTECKAEFRQSNQSKDFTHSVNKMEEGITTTNYIQIGNILHRVFSTIHTSEDVDKALSQLKSDGVLCDDEPALNRITDILRKRLEHPKVADWFSSRWKIFNECTLLTVQEGRIIERRPDRVMTDGEEWIVIDFKFGRPHDEYHRQVQEYMQMLRSMGNTNIHGFLWYVYSNEITEVSL